MKKVFLTFAACAAGCAALLLAACASAPKFSSVVNKDWCLVEVQAKNAGVAFDRSKLAYEGFPEIFTLRFDAERVSGIGASNRYFAPYTLADKQAIAIKTVAGTLMAPLHEPEKLKEKDFFNFLQSAYKWDAAKGNLRLFAKAPDGGAVVMVFAPAGKGKGKK